MKRFFQTAVVCLFIWSCNTRTNNPSVINETYNPTDEELYAACAELQGVGQFIIGRTTFKQVLADNDFKKTVIYSFDKKSNLFNGHWGSKFWKAKDVAYELPGGDKEKWIIRTAIRISTPNPCSKAGTPICGPMRTAWKPWTARRATRRVTLTWQRSRGGMTKIRRAEP